MKPLSLVLGPIDMRVSAEAMRFVLFPLAIKDVPIRMPENASAFCLVVAPTALIFCSIGPDLHPETVAHIVHPLALIHSAIIESILRSKFQFGFIAATRARQLAITDEIAISVARIV